MNTAEKMPSERPGRAAPPDLTWRRQAIANAVAAGVWRTDPQPIEASIAGVRCLAFGRGHGMDCSGTVVHFHGGGFRQGCPEMAGPFAAGLASRCSVEVILPAYRLAPEYPLPAALHDGMAVIHALAGTSEMPLILSGDSAGGGLAASLAQLCMAEGIRLAGLVLLSPWLDLTVSSDCYAVNAENDPLFSRQSASEAAAQYLQGFPARDPLASALFAEPDRFPPALISVGTGEVLAEDAFCFRDALRISGVEAKLCAIDGMEHTAAVRDPALPGGAETLDAVTQFISRRATGRSTGQSQRA